ncbi:uncharacterized protein BJ212DRAFT_1298317 [Suillus subaureus]|uniref:Uncharacterized protein n=1 Tax=Suillus subaureus TaxID=48587 RepID=A0A9P7EF13_9AGAM|nr:uncharacterized protein BJ212DRAFT_1298317 [Suillus subaureus]KAG1819028.1 hypothetical protein BJ212DRAFT_1298317 [Suillus subaureus]
MITLGINSERRGSGLVPLLAKGGIFMIFPSEKTPESYPGRYSLSICRKGGGYSTCKEIWIDLQELGILKMFGNWSTGRDNNQPTRGCEDHLISRSDMDYHMGTYPMVPPVDQANGIYTYAWAKLVESYFPVSNAWPGKMGWSVCEVISWADVEHSDCGLIGADAIKWADGKEYLMVSDGPMECIG